MTDPVQDPPKDPKDPPKAPSGAPPAPKDPGPYEPDENAKAYAERLAAKRIEASQRDLAKTQKELEDLRKKNETEDEKRQREQAEALETAKADANAKADQRADFMAIAMSKGLTKAQAAAWHGVAVGMEADLSQPEQAVETVAGSLGIKDFNKRPVVGDGRNAPTGTHEFSEEYVNEQIQAKGPQWLTQERRKKLEEWRSSQPGYIRRL